MSSLQKKITLCFFGTLFLCGLIALAFFFFSTSQSQAPARLTAETPDVQLPDSESEPLPEEKRPEELPVVVEGKVIDSFADCEAAGYPIMESFPLKCRANGMTFTDTVAQVGSTTSVGGADQAHTCSAEEKATQICTMEYAPVCGLVEVQCVTTPCDPVPETFSNGCSACSQGNVISYTPGACEM